MIRVAIADDHRLLREGLKYILHDACDIVIVAEAENGEGAVSLARQGGIDLLILDLSMPGLSGVELIRNVRSEGPSLSILVLTMFEEEHYAIRAIQAGAKGYLNKSCAGSQLIMAIRKITSGNLFVSDTVAYQLSMNIIDSDEQHLHLLLSDREFEVFSYLVRGKKISEIAAALDVSTKTVSSQKSRIMEKMKLHSLCDLIQYAIANRLVFPLQ